MGQALAVLPTATALLGATLLVAIAPFIKGRRNAMDIGALLVALVSLAMCVLLLHEVGDGPFVYWLGGWEPRGGVALGIGLVADGTGAGMATLSASLIVIALLNFFF